MARVEIYNGYSSIIPIFIHTSDLGGPIKIKEEPLDHDENNDEHSLPDATIDKPETTFDTKIQNHAETKVNLLNNIVTSRSKCTTAGSLSTHKNNSENHVDSSKIFSINSIKSYNDQSRTEIGNDIIDTRLRTRTRSNIVECDICYIICTDQKALRAHKSRYNKRRLVCHICKLSFMTPIHLTSHRRSVHRGVNWRCYNYECHYCKLRFRKKYILQQHIFHYHNINEIFNNKRSRCRPKNRSIKHEKISLNSKSHNSRQNKRKCSTVMVNDDSRKKLAISSEANELILQYEEQKNHFDNDKQIDDVIKLQQSSSISDSQNDHNISLNSSKFLINPPLVKICAVPNELETLLNDYDETNETDDSSSVISNSSDDSNYSVMTDISMDEYLPKKYSLRPRTVNSLSYDDTKNCSTEQKWTMSQKNYNCRDCRIELKKLSLPSSNDNKLSNEIMNYTNTRNDETIQINSRPTLGMELKNLDLALKKLEDIHHKQDEILNNETYNLPGDSPISNESESIEESSSSQATTVEDITTNKIVYMSSLCQTRYTTKKKLIFHYLCFHTNPRYQDCAVCRSQYTNIGELTDHLSEHCIEIPDSQNEKSPLDPKGPCENCKEKYTCKGCRMKFWLVSNLREHEQHCPIVDKMKENDSSNNVRVDEETVNEEIVNAEIVNEEIVDKSSINDNSTEKNQNNVIAVDSSIKPSESIEKSSTENYHQKNVDSDRLLSCKICRSLFKTTSNLEEHIRKFSLRKRKSYYCYRCGTPFPSPSLLSAHTRAAHLPESTMYQIHCTICQQGFNAARTLRQHVMHIHREELNNHIDDVPKVFWKVEKTCSICKTIFSDRKRFIEHSMYYYDDETIECSMCGDHFLGRYKAHAHTKTVHYSPEMRQSYSYCCNICFEGFVYPSHLYSHMYHVHNTEIEHERNINISGINHNNQHGLFYMCGICHETFDTPTLLDDHQIEYSNIGDYSCSKCQRKFQTNLLLERHIELSHSGKNHVGQIECYSCHEILQSKSSWLCHLRHFHINTNSNNRPSEMWQRIERPKDKSSEHLSVTASLPVNNSTSENEINKTVSAVINDTGNNEDSRVSNQMQIEYTCALCDMKFMNSSELKTHSLKFGNTCVNNTGTVNANFSIASIYSVELEDYEKLCDTKDDDSNKIKNDEENKISEIKDIEKAEQKNDNDANIISKILREKKSNVKLSCKKCHLNFTNHAALRKHEILYSNVGDYECNICQRKFRLIGHYQTHYRKHENRQRETSTPTHYCKTCDEKFVSENSRHCHFAHIHGVLLKTTQMPVSNLPRRSSPRQSKPSLQTNLDSFLSPNSTVEKLKESENTSHNLKMHIDVICEKQVFTDESTTNINPNIILNPMAQKNSSVNIHKDNFTISENLQEVSNSSIIPDAIPVNSRNKPMTIVERNEQVMEEHEIVDVENEIVDIEGETINKEKEIVVDDEIIELENEPVNKTSSELCDICGDAFTNRQDLVVHQKNSHNMEMIVEPQNNTQSEFIDIESIIEDEDGNENDNVATDFDNTDIDIIFDSTRACDDDVHVDENGEENNVNQRCVVVHPMKPNKTHSKKNQLECKICHMKFPHLYKLGEHLEEQHQTDSPSEIDNIQNPRVSSSSKLVNDIKHQYSHRHLQLCCKFCNKKFSNDQYLIAHIKNAHSALLNFKSSHKNGKIVIGHQTKSNTISNVSNSTQENSITIDNVQNYSQDTKIINFTKNSTAVIGKSLDVVKKSNDGIVLRKIILKQDFDVPQNLITPGPTRFPRLVPIPRNTLIIPFNRQTSPKLNQQHNNNDVPR